MIEPSVRVRNYRPEDLPAICGLEVDLFGVEAWSATVWSELVAGHARRAIVAVDHREVVVGHALSGVVGDFAELLRIGVRSDRQRLGVARQLLDELTRMAAADGSDRMLLEVSAKNSAARAFYSRSGFRQIDVRRNYYRDGSDALVLQGPVEPSGRMGP